MNAFQHTRKAQSLIERTKEYLLHSFIHPKLHGCDLILPITYEEA